MDKWGDKVLEISDEQKIIFIIVFLIFILVFGTIGYQFLLNVSFVDALYMTVITISTVGYTEVGEMSPAAQLFSIFIIFLGLGTVGYGLTSLGSIFFEGSLRENWRKKKMETRIDNLENHYILCGGGETGESVINYFLKSGVDFIVIEIREERVKELIEQGILALQGDATQEETLKRARIDTARGFISSLPEDASNVFTVLTARQMNPKLFIVSRAIESSAVGKLKKAGANNTISPNEIGGTRMAAVLLRPSVISFLDIITRAGEVILDLEDVEICKSSMLNNQTLREARIPEKTGLIILAIKRKGEEELSLNPSSEQTLQEGDAMIVLGKKEQIDHLREIACDSAIREFHNKED